MVKPESATLAPCTGRFVHLTKTKLLLIFSNHLHSRLKDPSLRREVNEGIFTIVDDTCFEHLSHEVIALTGTFTNTGKN